MALRHQTTHANLLYRVEKVYAGTLPAHTGL